MAMSEKIREGFEVFSHDGQKAVGTVLQAREGELLIYVENAGEFVVPLGAVRDAHSEKVILDIGKLSSRLVDAIRRAHSAEDPKI